MKELQAVIITYGELETKLSCPISRHYLCSLVSGVRLMVGNSIKILLLPSKFELCMSYIQVRCFATLSSQLAIQLCQISFTATSRGE
jgi:hypothetical protein